MKGKRGRENGDFGGDRKHGERRPAVAGGSPDHSLGPRAGARAAAQFPVRAALAVQAAADGGMVRGDVTERVRNRNRTSGFPDRHHRGGGDDRQTPQQRKRGGDKADKAIAA